MNVQYLKIAGLTYQVPLSLTLNENYSPFIISHDEVEQINSTITIESISVNSKKICHKGLMIDDRKELSIYKVDKDFYYASLNTKGSEVVYELYASPKWDKIVLSENCLHDCDASIIDILMMLTFIYSGAFFNTILLHSSCIKYGDNVLAFIGQSGVGKSTHSRLWLAHVPNTMLLNDDQPAVRVLNDGKILIFGTPWSGKTYCYKNDQGMLKGIIRLKQAPINKITSLNPVSLFQELLSSSSMIKADPETFKQITATLAMLSSKVPGFILENRPEKEAVELVYTHTLEKYDKITVS